MFYTTFVGTSFWPTSKFLKVSTVYYSALVIHNPRGLGVIILGEEIIKKAHVSCSLKS